MSTLATLQGNVAGVLGLDYDSSSPSSGDGPRLLGWANDGVIDLLIRTHCYIKSANFTLTAGTGQISLQSLGDVLQTWGSLTAGTLTGSAIGSMTLNQSSNNIAALGPISTAILMYAHIGPFSRYVIDKVDQQIAAMDAGQWTAPAIIAPPVPPAAAPAPAMALAK